jgi:anthraniloyl-CoA monooxygenase
MRITCVGGGPAGLYFATLAKLADPDNEVTVLERNPAGVTWGWGVVFWDDLLDDLFKYDPVSAERIWEAAYKWDEYEVRATGKPTTHLAGYGFSLGRHRLLEILAERAVEVGVDISWSDELADLADLPPSDLIVACDGARSRVREAHAEHFGAEVEIARNKYIWLGTPKVFDTFTFGFEQTPAGWVWFHAYPFDGHTSTFIVECTPATWSALGFGELDARAGTEKLRQIFASHLDGAELIDQRADLGGTGWLNFRRVTAQRWDHGNVVLMGDSAHTTHFAIGSGTKLAMQDAMALADAVASGDDLPVALERYEHRRKVALAPLQRAARASSNWFEHMPEYAHLPARRFSYALSNRRGEYATWRYLLHMATQSTIPRRMLRWTLSARRWSRARRRTDATNVTTGHAILPNTA